MDFWLNNKYVLTILDVISFLNKLLVLIWLVLFIDVVLFSKQRNLTKTSNNNYAPKQDITEI